MRQTLSAPQLWPHIVQFQDTIKHQKTLQRKQSSTGFRENLRFVRGNSKVYSKVLSKGDISSDDEFEKKPLEPVLEMESPKKFDGNAPVVRLPCEVWRHESIVRPDRAGCVI